MLLRMDNYIQSQRYTRQGKFVLRTSSVRARGTTGVFSHKQIVDEQAHIAVELTHGLGDAAHGLRFDEADGEARELEIVDY
jgi:hypothetical protein